MRKIVYIFLDELAAFTDYCAVGILVVVLPFMY
jgi:hypothetical protein